LKEFRKTALTPDVIARAVLYAVCPSQMMSMSMKLLFARQPAPSALQRPLTCFEVSEQAGAVEWNLCHDAHSLPLCSSLLKQLCKESHQQKIMKQLQVSANYFTAFVQIHLINR